MSVKVLVAIETFFRRDKRQFWIFHCVFQKNRSDRLFIMSVLISVFTECLCGFLQFQGSVTSLYLKIPILYIFLVISGISTEAPENGYSPRKL